jgi:hypothetical protein
VVDAIAPTFDSLSAQTGFDGWGFSTPPSRSLNSQEPGGINIDSHQFLGNPIIHPHTCGFADSVGRMNGCSLSCNAALAPRLLVAEIPLKSVDAGVASLK